MNNRIKKDNICRLCGKKKPVYISLCDDCLKRYLKENPRFEDTPLSLWIEIEIQKNG